ncbi:hypothetical protein D3C87_2115160 [compost metagenome]
MIAVFHGFHRQGVSQGAGEDHGHSRAEQRNEGGHTVCPVDGVVLEYQLEGLQAELLREEGIPVPQQRRLRGEGAGDNGPEGH